MLPCLNLELSVRACLVKPWSRGNPATSTPSPPSFIFSRILRGGNIRRSPDGSFSFLRHRNKPPFFFRAKGMSSFFYFYFFLFSWPLTCEKKIKTFFFFETDVSRVFFLTTSEQLSLSRKRRPTCSVVLFPSSLPRQDAEIPFLLLPGEKESTRV